MHSSYLRRRKIQACVRPHAATDAGRSLVGVVADCCVRQHDVAYAYDENTTRNYSNHEQLQYVMRRSVNELLSCWSAAAVDAICCRLAQRTGHCPWSHTKDVFKWGAGIKCCFISRKNLYTVLWNIFKNTPNKISTRHFRPHRMHSKDAACCWCVWAGHIDWTLVVSLRIRWGCTSAPPCECDGSIFGVGDALL